MTKNCCVFKLYFKVTTEFFFLEIQDNSGVDKTKSGYKLNFLFPARIETKSLPYMFIVILIKNYALDFPKTSKSLNQKSLYYL